MENESQKSFYNQEGRKKEDMKRGRRKKKLESFLGPRTP
jgi:hypothetical protein